MLSCRQPVHCCDEVMDGAGSKDRCCAECHSQQLTWPLICCSSPCTCCCDSHLSLYILVLPLSEKSLLQGMKLFQFPDDTKRCSLIEGFTVLVQVFLNCTYLDFCHSLKHLNRVQCNNFEKCLCLFEIQQQILTTGVVFMTMRLWRLTVNNNTCSCALNKYMKCWQTKPVYCMFVSSMAELYFAINLVLQDKLDRP